MTPKGWNFQSSKLPDILKMHQMRLTIVSTLGLEITITCTPFSLEFFCFVLLYFVCLKFLPLLSSPETTAKFTEKQISCVITNNQEMMCVLLPPSMKHCDQWRVVSNTRHCFESVKGRGSRWNSGLLHTTFPVSTCHDWWQVKTLPLTPCDRGGQSWRGSEVR